MAVTYTLDGAFGQPLVVASDAATTLILYGKYAIGEYKLNAAPAEAWQYYLGDGELSVRQLADSDGNIGLTRTYAPYGRLLAKEGDGAALFGYAGGQAGVDGLWYFGDGYYDPQTGEFLAAGKSIPPAPLAAAGGLLFAPMLLWGWRRKKKGKGWLPPAGLFMLVLFVAAGLTKYEFANAETSETIQKSPALQLEVESIRSPISIATWIPAPFPTVTVVKITATPLCRPEPTATSVSVPTIIITNDPQPTLTHDLEVIINFTPNDVDSWSDTEKSVIKNGANKVAARLARVIKQNHPTWDVDQYPNKAFLMVYGAPVTFEKLTDTCREYYIKKNQNINGCWAETQNENLIYVFDNATIFANSASSEHWAVHELGHAFVWATGSSNPVDTLDIAIHGTKRTNNAPSQRGNSRMGRPPDGELWGFAGGRTAWQNSWSDHTSEVFADMYTGWVYDDSWEIALDENLEEKFDNNKDPIITFDGQNRLRFMRRYMSNWIEEAIKYGN